MRERWVVAMSGGVDSSVAAAELVGSGLEVIGVTMDLGAGSGVSAGSSRDAGRCCGLPDAVDARAVARRLGIRHYTFDYRDAFRAAVIDPFVEAYEAGRTPIPCIPCNRVLKFDRLLRRAETLGARGVATGHYARIEPGPEGDLALYRARDRTKDQSYFLFDLPRKTLARLRFPIGALPKREVRERARRLHLETAEKPESQGICFVPNGRVREALTQLRPERRRSRGPILDRDGRVLGEHDGAAGYTLGQRRGLGLAGGPWYVSAVDPRRNEVTVDRAAALERRELQLSDVSWLIEKRPPRRLRVQVRHRAASVPARLEETGAGAYRVWLERTVWAPAVGQAAVFYHEDDARVLGGGWIAGSG
ncbi:MAG: tRNA 2-thiouridine(34) synthase MnmA [Myxococcota bacterium]